MTENMQGETSEMNTEEVENYILYDMLYKSKTSNETIKYIHQELVRKENRKINLISRLNFNINLPEVIKTIDRDEVSLQMNIAQLLMKISYPE